MVPYRTYKRLLYTCSIQIPATHTHTHRQLSTGESVRDSSIIENCLATSPRLSFLQQSSCAIFSNIIIFFDRGRKMSSFPVSVRSPPPFHSLPPSPPSSPHRRRHSRDCQSEMVIKRFGAISVIWIYCAFGFDGFFLSHPPPPLLLIFSHLNTADNWNKIELKSRMAVIGWRFMSKRGNAAQWIRKHHPIETATLAIENNRGRRNPSWRPQLLHRCLIFHRRK